MKVDILGISVDAYSLRETAELIRQAVETGLRIRVITANPEIIYAAGRNDELKKLINSAEIVTADGIGVVWAARRLGTPLPERVTGIDLAKAVFPMAQAGNWRIFLLGGKPGVAEQAAGQVGRKNRGIVWETRHGYFSPAEEPEIIEKIRLFQPDVLLVGLGAPRQEYWLAEYSGLAAASIGVGGSFDVLAGVVPRAPQKVQDFHLEWLYRLVKEPWRWKRQAVLPCFVLKALGQSLKRRFGR